MKLQAWYQSGYRNVNCDDHRAIFTFNVCIAAGVRSNLNNDILKVVCLINSIGTVHG